MGEPDEDILLGHFNRLLWYWTKRRKLSMSASFLKVNRQYVPHIVWSTATLPFLAGKAKAFERIKRIETREGRP